MVFCCARVLLVLRSPLLDNLMLMQSCGLFFQLYSFHKSGYVGSYCFLPDTVSNSYLSRFCNSLRDHVLYCLAEIKKRDNDYHLICIVWGITLQPLQVLSEMLVAFFLFLGKKVGCWKGNLKKIFSVISVCILHA